MTFNKGPLKQTEVLTIQAKQGLTASTPQYPMKLL